MKIAKVYLSEGALKVREFAVSDIEPHGSFLYLYLDSNEDAAYKNLVAIIPARNLISVELTEMSE